MLQVADMNVDVWKRNDVAEERLKAIETVTNTTRTEIQNGIRSLTLQIGKASGKGITTNNNNNNNNNHGGFTAINMLRLVSGLLNVALFCR